MFTDYSLPDPVVSPLSAPVLMVKAPGFPGPAHPTEADLFCRQTSMPGHDQRRTESAHVGIVGCGGLGSWIAVAAARMGFRRLTLIDADRFDRSNAPRQMMFGGDIGQPKPHALARNLVPHMTNAGTITAIALPFPDALDQLTELPTVLVVGVDNNRARLAASKWGLTNSIPVVFAMLSLDGLRAQMFLQEPGGPCLSCVLPNLDPDSHLPCAAAAITSCMMAAAYAAAAIVAAVSGDTVPRWREASLDGSSDRSAHPPLRRGCHSCDPPDK